LFSVTSTGRSRRSTDVVLVVLAAGLLLPTWAWGEPRSASEQALIDLANSVPSFIVVVWRAGVWATGLWGMTLLLVSAARWHTDVLVDQVAAVATSAACIWVLGLASVDVAGIRALDLSGTDSPFVVVPVLVVVSTMSSVGSPRMTRPYRTLGRWVVVLGTVSVAMLGLSSPLGALASSLAGVVLAGVLRLALGSCGGDPDPERLAEGLRALGLSVTELAPTANRESGVAQFSALDHDGRPLLVRVCGRDARDTQVLVKAWRSIWYREAGALTLTRLQQVEHEALLTLVAAQAGVPVAAVIRVGQTPEKDAVLVYRVDGEPLEVGVGRAVLEAMWTTVAGLGSAGCAHGDLAPERFRLDGGRAVLLGLSGASLTPSGDQLRIDEAQLLVTSVLVGGLEPAVAVAQARLGPGGMVDLIPYLQIAALGPRLRDRVEDEGLDLRKLRAAVADRAGAEVPELARLRRVSVGSTLQAGTMAIAAYFLISALAGIDGAAVADAVLGASSGLLLLALVMAQSPRVPQAGAARAACPRPLPFGPVLMLQYAITFINLVIPSTAARVAVNVRFFRKQGIPPASAMSIGVIDSLGGFAGQVLVLTAVVVADFGNLDLDLARPQALGGGRLLALVGLLLVTVVALIAVVVAVPMLRARVTAKVRPLWDEVIQTVSGLRSPERVARIVGGNLLAELLFAGTMALVLAALGESLPLSTLLVINVAVGLFAALMPVPGGIGVSEGALVVGLTAAGLGDSTALAATICYRVCTYYLPPVWGGLVFRRMERTGLL